MASTLDEWAYYHALYHLVTHWAVFGATFVLLISIGLVINSSGPVRSPRFFQFAIIATGGASLFFLWRMSTFGQIVNGYLGNAVTPTRWLPEPWNLLLGGAATVALAVVDWVTLKQHTALTPRAPDVPAIS